jgi:two-component system NtrC family sensor kinase
MSDPLQDKRMNDLFTAEVDWRVRVFDSLSFPTLIMTPDKKILSANRIFLQKYGMTMAQVVSKRCYQVFYSADRCPESTCPLARVLKEKKGHTITRRIFSRTHKRMWEDRVFSPILDDSGEIAYIMESVRDITRLKTLEKALKETKEFLQKLIQSSPMAIVAADRYGNILLMNHAAEDLFGYSAERASRETRVDQLYPPGTAADIMRMLKDREFGGVGKLAARQIVILNSKGEKIPVELTASILYEDDEEIATMGIYNDLREKLSAEAKLKDITAQLSQSEKMASMGRLAAGVAHEINNPLTGVLFYARLMQEKLGPEDPHRENLDFIIEDVNRCSEIVKNLLAYARVTNQRRDRIGLNALVQQSLALIRDQSLFRNIEMVKEFSDYEIEVHADRNQMSQVIINLVMNAVEAMGGSGRLVMRTYTDDRSGKSLLEIADTGGGISEANLSKIFDPFFTTKAAGTGTGLGLSTAYGIIKENRGNISVKSTGPAGTTFLLEFPPVAAANGEDASARESQI